MPLTFPPDPALNDETTTGGRTYRWNGEAWELVGSGFAGPTGPAGVVWQTPPLSGASTGNAGDVAYDDNYFYLRTSQAWRQVALLSISAETYRVLTEASDVITDEASNPIRSE